MPLVETVARMGPGEETTARFYFEKPPGAQRYRAEVVHFMPSTVPRKMTFGLEATLDLGDEHEIGFYMKDLWSRGGKMTVKDLGTRLTRHNREKLTKFFEGFTKRPALLYNHGKKKFTLALPPGTHVFSTDPYFFPFAMLMEDFERRDTKVEDRYEAVYGFWNDSGLRTRKVESQEKALPGSFLFSELPTSVVDPAQTTTLTFGMLQINTKAVHQSDVRADQETVAKTMNFLLKTLLGIFRLPKTLVSLVRADETSMSLRSRTLVANSGTTLRFKLLDDAPEYFMLADEDREFVFHLGIAHAENFKEMVFGEDPLAGLYPLTAIARDFGVATSYISGRGHEPVIALIRDHSEIKTPDLATISSRENTMSLIFLDKHLEQVRVEKECKVFLTLQLTGDGVV
jgi:hypothetical protein